MVVLCAIPFCKPWVVRDGEEFAALIFVVTRWHSLHPSIADVRVGVQQSSSELSNESI